MAVRDASKRGISDPRQAAYEPVSRSPPDVAFRQGFESRATDEKRRPFGFNVLFILSSGSDQAGSLFHQYRRADRLCGSGDGETEMNKTYAAAIVGVGALVFGADMARAVDAVTDDAVIIEDSASITQDDVKAAQIAWGEALVRISNDYAEGGIDAARATAEEVLDTAYGFQMGQVLFNPTLTEAPQSFRTTREGALAYFIGHDPDFPRDSGFALGGWSDVEIENYAIFIQGDIAKTMGNVHLTNAEGEVTTVYKTWGFVRDEEGDLRIVLHHSSLPFVQG